MRRLPLRAPHFRLWIDARAILATTLAILVWTAPRAVGAPAPAALPVTADECRAVVERITTLLAERYVWEDVGIACGEHLASQLEAGELDGISDPETFAERITDELQSVSHDKHMRVRHAEPRQAGQPESPVRAQRRRAERERRENYGFERVERLEGNIGYLDMRYFSGSPQARETAAAAMRFLANADAIVFDMRRNGGGNPDMIRYVCSYLFDGSIHLNSIYRRRGDTTVEYWTLEELPGPKMADVPVFVLSSSYTFSGAEEFCYNLQTRERGTIIGETTGGGANPGGTTRVNDRFEIFVPNGAAVNPITNTNWEGVGVKPDVEVDSEDALEIALVRAKAAAEARRHARSRDTDEALREFETARIRAMELARGGDAEEASDVLLPALTAAHDARLVGEDELNMLGYEYLGEGHADVAIAIFTFNVERFPTSANVYDSLGEAYMVKGEHERAIEFYERSIGLDPQNDNARQMIERMRGG